MNQLITDDQIKSAKTWTELYFSAGISPRNKKACQTVQEEVRRRFPDSHLERYGSTVTKVTDDEFITAVKSSVSIRDTLKKCGMSAVGAAYSTFHKRVKRLGLDTSHFLGQAAARNKPSATKRNLDEYLCLDGPTIGSHNLKLKLISEGIKSHRCEICACTEWMGKPVPITLDHINGKPNDNRLANLRILCPNCHAQTETFCGKNMKKPKAKCQVCGEIVRDRGRKTCGDNKCTTHLNSSRPRRSKKN